MPWLNYVGCIVVAIIMIPNIAYAIKYKNGFENRYQNKAAELFEQIGRYGCMAFMIFNVPYTYFNFWFEGAFVVYIIVNALLCATYLLGWVVFWAKSNRARAITLSVLPSCVFLFGGIMLINIPLCIAAVIFAPCHILISCKNAK